MPSLDPLKRVARLRTAHQRRGAGEGDGRIPPGQVETHKFPVLTYGRSPRVSRDEWRLRAFGLVEEEREWDWESFLALPSKDQVVDIHCVTRWSKLDTAWTGIPFTEFMQQVKPLPRADHVMLHCYGGYTTNMRLDEMLEEDVMFAHAYDGKPLERDHGGPMRLVVPKLYFWKSAKWIEGVEFMQGNRPGFWEQHGYHMHGDPFLEERFS